MFIRSIAVIFIALSLSVSVYADKKPENVTINIKTITCSGKRVVSRKNPIVVHDSIRNLKSKLKQIPFKNFNLVSSESITIPSESKQQIKLKNKDSLGLELLYLKQDRVGLWLDWADKEGMRLLDTRLHFDCMETMLAGADTESDTCKMLAISVEGKK